MKRTVAVDPGLRGCGVAMFDDGVLMSAWYEKNPELTGDGMEAILAMAMAVRHAAADEVVVEFPHVYAGSKSKGDPHDLLVLAAIDGAIGAFATIPLGGRDGAKVRHVFPSEWKGQLDKDACWHRVEGRLQEFEKRIIHWPCASLRHNVQDALGIGLFAVGRFERKMVIHR